MKSEDEKTHDETNSRHLSAQSSPTDLVSCTGHHRMNWWKTSNWTESSRNFSHCCETHRFIRCVEGVWQHCKKRYELDEHRLTRCYGESSTATIRWSTGHYSATNMYAPILVVCIKHWLRWCVEQAADKAKTRSGNHRQKALILVVLLRRTCTARVGEVNAHPK
jgi:hypothetical protein